MRQNVTPQAQPTVNAPLPADTVRVHDTLQVHDTTEVWVLRPEDGWLAKLTSWAGAIAALAGAGATFFAWRGTRITQIEAEKARQKEVLQQEAALIAWRAQVRASVSLLVGVAMEVTDAFILGHDSPNWLRGIAERIRAEHDRWLVLVDQAAKLRVERLQQVEAVHGNLAEALQSLYVTLGLLRIDPPTSPLRQDLQDDLFKADGAITLLIKAGEGATALADANDMDTASAGGARHGTIGPGV